MCWFRGDIEGREPITIVNIYSLCDFEAKRRLWEEIKERRQRSYCDRWCVGLLIGFLVYD